MNFQLTKKLISVHDSNLFVANPFLRLSPVPTNQDYRFGLLETEGAMDLFDLPDTIC